MSDNGKIVVLFNKTIPEFDTELIWITEQNIVVINQSNKTKLLYHQCMFG